MTSKEDEHWLAVLASTAKDVTKNAITWAVIAGITGWFAHANLNPTSDMKQVLQQLRILNVKVGALVDSQPEPQKAKTVALINTRIVASLDPMQP